MSDMERSTTYEVWLAERAVVAAWCQTVDAAMPRAVRVVPRGAVEAEFLRARGTPEALIGPVARETDEIGEAGFWRRMGRRDLRTPASG
jgi:hypothetical protein